jgi:ATP-dependent helicase/nuclease subunit A
MRKPEDAKYRERIITDLDISMLVEAGAGSGKTTSLVGRMLALIATGRCTVDRMAAVTFTRKAAAELKGRFQEKLEEAYKKEKDPAKRERYQHTLARLELLFAGTIHSFCTRLLRERPIEARIDPDFEELEESEDVLLRDQCWHEYLEGLHVEGSPVLRKVAELGLKPADMIETYQHLTLYPEVEAARRKRKEPDFSNEKKRLTGYLDQAARALPREVPAKGWDALQTLLKSALRLRRALDLNKTSDFIRLLSALNKSGAITQNRWSSKDLAKEQKSLFDSFKQEVIEISLARWRKHCHYFVLELVLPAVAHFKSVRDENSQMNFHDLLMRAAELLRDNLEVRAYFKKRYTHILVDEFQDTDPVQAEVLLYLTGEGQEKNPWNQLTVRPGSLFIVGDPKQSIYRFRRADIDTYNEVKSIIEKSGGKVLSLTANFRSLSSVCDWVNPVFQEKFPKEATSFQAAFEPLKAYQQQKEGGVKRITLQKEERNNQRAVAGRDAERIASWIDWALKGNFKAVRSPDEISEGKTEVAGPGDFMILLHYRSHLSLYARALEERGIPYDISGGGAFNDSQELLHLLNLLTAVVDPEDQVALVATLRGPFYGVSDDLLYRFKKERGVFSFLSKQETCQDKKVLQQIGPFLEEIRTFYHLTRIKPAAAALSMILDQLGVIPLALTQEMGGSRAGNLLKALELAFRELSRDAISFADIVERLRQHHQELEVEEMSVEPGKQDAVRIMNLHKAKGLEATVVFLADPVKGVLHDPDLHINRTEEKAVGYFIARTKKNEFSSEIIGLPPDWKRYKPLEQKYQQAEADRLLYVATTRAKQLLVVSTYPEKPDKGAWKDLYPYLDGVEELESPEPSLAIPVKKKIAEKEFEEARREVEKKIARSKEPSYVTETVTAQAKPAAGGTPFRKDTGKGMSWGRVIHRMLESLARDDACNLDLMAENLLKEEGRPLLEKDAVVETVKQVVASKLWGRMKESETALFEVPFSTRLDEQGNPKVMSGTIDLAFREPDGWVLADYKTDTVGERLSDLVDYYRPQVDTYRTLWQAMSGEQVKEAGLFFVDGSQWVEV